MLERMHQILGKKLTTKNLQKYDFNGMDPWSELLASVAWAICSTHHTTLQATPGQLAFGRDMLSNLNCTDRKANKLKKEKDVDSNNRKENSLRISFEA